MCLKYSLRWKYSYLYLNHVLFNFIFHPKNYKIASQNTNFHLLWSLSEQNDFTRSFSQQITSTHAWITLKTCWQHSSCSTRPVLQIILTRAWITLKFFLPFIPTTCPHTAWNERSVTWLLLKHLYLFGESRIGLSCIISRTQTHFCNANTRPIEQIPYTSSIPHIAQHILFVPRTTLKYRSVFLYNYGMKLLSSDEIILYSSGDNACKLLRKKNHE